MEGEGKVLFGSIPGPRGPQNLVFTCPAGSLGRGACPGPPTNLSLCHSHPYGSRSGGVKVGEIQEVESRGWALAQPHRTRAEPPVVQRGFLLPPCPEGDWALAQVSGSWSSPRSLRCSGVPHGSQTLSAIDTWAFLSLEGFENLVEGIPVAPVSSTGIFLRPPPARTPPRAPPAPSCTHAPRPTRAPVPGSLPEKLHGKGDASPWLPASMHPSIPQRHGRRGTAAAPRRLAPEQVKEAHLTTEIGYLIIV